MPRSNRQLFGWNDSILTGWSTTLTSSSRPHSTVNSRSISEYSSWSGRWISSASSSLPSNTHFQLICHLMWEMFQKDVTKIFRKRRKPLSDIAKVYPTSKKSSTLSYFSRLTSMSANLVFLEDWLISSKILLPGKLSTTFRLRILTLAFGIDMHHRCQSIGGVFSIRVTRDRTIFLISAMTTVSSPQLTIKMHKETWRISL